MKRETLIKKFLITYLAMNILMLFATLLIISILFKSILVHHIMAMNDNFILTHKEEILTREKTSEVKSIANKETDTFVSLIKFYGVDYILNEKVIEKNSSIKKILSQKDDKHIEENNNKQFVAYSVIKENTHSKGEVILGVLEITYDMSYILDKFYILRISLAIFEILLFIFIYFATTYLFRQHIKKPLDSLKNALEEVIKENYENSMEYSKNDEIGELVKIYNKMIWTIQSRTKKLENEMKLKLKLKEQNIEYQNNLGNMVEERTKKLYWLTEKLKKRNNELVSLQSQMVHQEKLTAIGQLSAGIAHEINNPLGFINSNFSVLKKYIEIMERIIKNPEDNRDRVQLDYILDDLPGLLEETTEGIERIKVIVKNLKDFSRPDDNQEVVEYDMNEGLESTLIVSKNEYKYDCDIIKNFGDIPIVYAKAGEINQVFLNIIINATHAIKEKKIHGIIQITTYQKEDYCYCEIMDNGNGIPKTIQDKIFNPFFTTKDPGKGTGLGLNISFNIIMKHKGILNVESKEGEYTKFIIALPIKNKIT